MAQSLQCEPFAIAGRRAFWTTQPDACGTSPGCVPNTQCGVPGLLLSTDDDGAASFANNDAVRSLALNMLMTDERRRDTRCGHIPGTLNGHWSESFIQNGKPVGSSVRYVSGSTTIRDAELAIKAEVQTTLQKLIDYGVAVEVEVQTKYLGGGLIGMDIAIYGVASDPSRIAMTAKRNDNAWVWGV